MSRLNHHGYLLGLVGCLAAGAGLGLLLAPALRRDTPEESDKHVVVADDAPPRESTELEQLRRQVLALKRDQAALEQRLEGKEPTSAAGSEGQGASAQQELDDDPGEGLTEREQMELFREQQQQDFSKQGLDPSWSASREALIHASLSSPKWTALGYKLTNAECRSSMCKIELSAPPNARANFGNMLFDPPFEGQVSFFFTDDNSIVAYAARPPE